MKKILFSNIPVIYFAGAVTGALVGFLLLMATLNAWNLYRTFTQSAQGNSEQYVTINKKIGLLNTVSNRLSGFSEAEMDTIRRQEFVADMAPYVRSAFGVEASRSASSRMPYMRTEMFFEAVPNRFIDKVPDNWHWHKGSNHIPVLIPKQYLNLYNFGFAKSQGLPNVSAGLIGQFTFKITLYNQQRTEHYKGSIAGFSNRIQSLLVPMDFLKNANQRFAPNTERQPDRLIIKLEPNMEQDLYKFLSRKGYETTHDAFQGGKIALFVHISGSVLLVIAGVIILLALIVYALTLQLTVQRNKDEIYQLLLLGYKPFAIFRYYFVVQFTVAAMVLLLSGTAIYFATRRALTFLANRYIELENFSSAPVFFTAFIVMLIFILITGFNTWRLVKKLGRWGTL